MIFGKPSDRCVICVGLTTSGCRIVVADGYIHSSGRCFELWRKGMRPLRIHEAVR